VVGRFGLGAIAHGVRTPRWRHRGVLTMDLERIPAEVFVVVGREREAGLALQRLGFRVLHVGTTISVEATADLWESIFKVRFQQQRMRQMPDLLPDRETAFRRADTAGLRIPDELQGLVTEVNFPKPPELF
jgi:hypothetical protein